MNTKKCIKCNEIKHLDLFPIRSCTGKHRSECKECTKKKAEEFKLKRLNKSKPIIMEKTCVKCLMVKSVDHFHKNSAHSDGYVNECKDCRKLKSKEFYSVKKEVIKSKNKERYNQNKNDINFKNKRKDLRLQKREEINKRRKFLRNRDDKYRTYMREYERERKSSDPFFKLKRQIRGRVGDALKNYEMYNTISSINDMGCDIKFFKKYIESLFTEGMNWDLHGKGEGRFHLDHIIPLDFLKDKQDNREAFLVVLNYRNYRPMWENENLSKNSKMSDNWKEHYEYIKSELKKEGKL